MGSISSYTWLVIGVLLTLYNVYGLRWGLNYKGKGMKWFRGWRRVSYFIRVVPFPVIWATDCLSMALSYGILVWIIYDLAENLLVYGQWIGGGACKLTNGASSISIKSEVWGFSTKLSVLTLLCLSIIFSW